MVDGEVGVITENHVVIFFARTLRIKKPPVCELVGFVFP